MITKNQHFIPQSVLKLFKESDEIQNHKQKRIFHILHDRRNNVYPSTLDKTMSRPFFYEHKNLKQNRFEDLLHVFERSYSRDLGTFEYKVVRYENKLIKFSELKRAAFEIIEAMLKMHLRSGALLYELSFWEEGSEKASLYQMLARFFDSHYIKDFGQTIKNYHEFSILKSSASNFIISDQFLVTAALSFKAQFANATNRNIGQKDVLLLLPISKNYYLCFYNGAKPAYIQSNKFCVLNADQTLEINKTIINNSYMETAGPSKLVLENVAKFYVDQSPTAVYLGGDNFSGGAELRKEVFFYNKDWEIYNFIRRPHRWADFRNVTKNELCPCKSGKPYKECCRYKANALDSFMERLKTQNGNQYFSPYTIPGCTFKEMNIFEFLK